MNVVKTILLVAFVIICIILVLLVLVQDENDNGMGGVFGGNSAAFGAHSSSILSKTTGVFAVLFFVAAFFLAFLNRTPKDSGNIQSAVEQTQTVTAEDEAANQAVEAAGSTSNWLEEESK